MGSEVARNGWHEKCDEERLLLLEVEERNKQ
jgi:hypothetical protein